MSDEPKKTQEETDDRFSWGDGELCVIDPETGESIRIGEAPPEAKKDAERVRVDSKINAALKKLKTPR